MVVEHLYMTGRPDHTMVLTFDNAMETISWVAQVEQIKDNMDVILRSQASDADKNAFAMLWVAHVRRFAAQWGNDRTPPDIKSALNETEETLGIPISNWT